MVFNNLDAFESFFNKKLDSIAKKITRQAKAEFSKKIDELNKAFLNSSDYNNIKGSLLGEYGFTSEEVSALDNIVDAMNRVSDIESTDTSYVVQYVNLEELHKQPEAAHSLFVSPDSGEQVSWTRWLEEGASVLGYSFSDDQSKSSRSGKGTMKAGGGWRLRPTRAFSEIAKKVGIDDVKKIMTLSIRKIKK